jgi:hypothetical protein
MVKQKQRGRPRSRRGRMSSIESEVSSMKVMIAVIKKDTALMLLVVLSSALEEQWHEGTISRDVAEWIYNFCKDSAIRRGYISE